MTSAGEKTQSGERGWAEWGAGGATILRGARRILKGLAEKVASERGCKSLCSLGRTRKSAQGYPLDGSERRRAAL